jgi:hypothetical protein
MQKLTRAVLFGSTLALAACGGGSDVAHGSGSLTGAASFTVLSAYENAPMNGDQPDLSEIELVMASQDLSCSDVQSNSAPPPHFLELLVQGPSALTPGTYPVKPLGTQFDGTNPIAVAGTFAELSSDYSPTDGTVTLEIVSATQLKGSFDLTDGTEELTGTFDSHFCSVPEAFQ